MNLNQTGKISSKQVLKFFCWLLSFFLYHLTEYGNRWAASSRGLWKIGTSGIPFATLPGVFTSILTLILISWVVFFRKAGFYASITILFLRFIRLGLNLLQHNLMIMPGIFMGLVALISVILIYQSNEQIIKTQKKYRKELEEFNKSIIGAFTITNDMTAKATLTGFLTRRFLKLQESFLLQTPLTQ